MKIQHSGKMILTAPGDREVRMVRDFDAPRELVWDAWTKPELLKRWLGVFAGNTMPVCEIDLRVGGRYRWVWRGAHCGADGGPGDMAMGGVYKELVHAVKIVSTEEWENPWFPGDSVNTLLFEDLGGGRTRCTNSVLYATKEARDLVLKTPMAEGVNAGYDQLDRVLAEVAPKARVA